MREKNVLSQLKYWISAVTVGIIFGLAIQFVSAWTEPTSTPPNGNIGAPLNTGALGQVKDAGLYINRTGASTNGLIVANGNVGIGTTSPSQKLHVAGNTQIDGAIVAPEGTLRDDGGGWIRTYGATGWYSQTYGGGWYMSDTTWLRGYNDKSVYTGGTIRGGELYTNDNVYLGYLGDWLSNRLNQGVYTNAQPQFARMYDDDRGYYIDANTQSRMASIRLNDVLDASVLHLASDSTIYLLTRNGGQVRVGTEWGGSGDIIVYDNIGANGRDPYYSVDTPGHMRATNYYNNSDIRLKKDISSLNGEETLQKVLQLQGVTYRLKKETEKNMDPNKLHLGFVAQEVEPIFPEIVVTDKSPEKLKSVSYESLVPALVEAIKEQQKQINEQREQLDELRQELKK